MIAELPNVIAAPPRVIAELPNVIAVLQRQGASRLHGHGNQAGNKTGENGFRRNEKNQHWKFQCGYK
jgi:hypothetical protein